MENKKMEIINEWISKDKEFSEFNLQVKNMGFIDLKDFLTKNIQNTIFPKVIQELIGERNEQD
jgi:hypothetical protein